MWSMDNSYTLAIDSSHNLDHLLNRITECHKFHEIGAHSFPCNCILMTVTNTSGNDFLLTFDQNLGFQQ